MSEPNGGTLQYRVRTLEEEVRLQRDRYHDLANSFQQVILKLQHATDELAHVDADVKVLGDELKSVRRAFYTFAISVVTGALGLSFTAFAIFGQSI